MRNLDVRTIAAMIDAGITFVAGVSSPGGQKTVFLEAEDVAPFVEDSADWFAKKNGVTKQDYLSWVACDGLPRCGATTKNGSRCKNSVSGGGQRSLLDWLSEDAGFCSLHGGENSHDARLRRWGRKT